MHINNFQIRRTVAVYNTILLHPSNLMNYTYKIVKINLTMRINM